jgi:hypothetical protein
MAAPRNLPAVTRHVDKDVVTDRDAEVTGRDTPASALPNLTLRYHIEVPDRPQ